VQVLLRHKAPKRKRNANVNVAKIAPAKAAPTANVAARSRSAKIAKTAKIAATRQKARDAAKANATNPETAIRQTAETAGNLLLSFYFKLKINFRFHSVCTTFAGLKNTCLIRWKT
jgi:hypothetical protein